MLANKEHHDILIKAQSNCATAKQIKEQSADMTKVSHDLLEQSKSVTAKARDSFAGLKIVFNQLLQLSADVPSQSSELSNKVADYQARYVDPCKTHAERLLTEAENILNTFGLDRGLGAERTLEAANAYQKIIKAVLGAGRAADEAFTLAIGLMDRVSRKNSDGYDLFAQADVGRVKSRDLRQEAEGLKQNSQEMQVQVEELILRWQSYILLVNKRREDLLTVERQLDGLQIVSVLADDALRNSENAVKRATTVHENVEKALERIELELRQKVREMQSFSPEELGNIPRKCKLNLELFSIAAKRWR